MVETNQLSPKHIECAKILLNNIAKGNYSITYKRLEELTGLSRFKKDGVPGHIGDLSILCNKLSLPLISVIVVNEEYGICGEGFFKLCKGLGVHPEYATSMNLMINACMQEVKQCTRWAEFANYLGLKIEGLNVNLNDNSTFYCKLDSTQLIEEKYTYNILSKYTGKNFDGNLKATWGNDIFQFWFPKMAYKNKKGELVPGDNNKNCLNKANDDWSEIVFEDLNKCENEPDESLTNAYVLTFAKEHKGNYTFRGVYRQDHERHKPYIYFYKKISDTAIISGNPPQLDIRNLELQEIKHIESVLETAPLLGREREAVVKIRENQGEFRKLLLSKYSKCHICGVNIKDCLIASHIKPWRDADDEEKIDPDNGLLLCPNHDKLFDSGYISFDENGKILISSELDSNNRLFLNIQDSMKIHLNCNNEEYMKYHREHIFKK